MSAAGPLIVVAAQEHAPHAVSAASGVVMGLAGGAAGFASSSVRAAGAATTGTIHERMAGLFTVAVERGELDRSVDIGVLTETLFDVW